jgi:N-terminal acetyltransferase B complex non-catalytic subunit
MNSVINLEENSNEKIVQSLFNDEIKTINDNIDQIMEDNMEKNEETKENQQLNEETKENQQLNEEVIAQIHQTSETLNKEINLIELNKETISDGSDSAETVREPIQNKEKDSDEVNLIVNQEDMKKTVEITQEIEVKPVFEQTCFAQTESEIREGDLSNLIEENQLERIEEINYKNDNFIQEKDNSETIEQTNLENQMEILETEPTKEQETDKQVVKKEQQKNLENQVEILESEPTKEQETGKQVETIEQEKTEIKQQEVKEPDTVIIVENIETVSNTINEENKNASFSETEIKETNNGNIFF